MDKNKNNNTRIEWVDMGKGICMSLVIYFHSQIYYANDFSSSFWFLPFYLSFFFFIAGYLFPWDRDIDLKQSLIHLFRRVILPYFIFTSIVWFPKALVHGNSIDILNGIENIVLGRASWFVTAYIVAQLLLLVIRKVTKSMTVLWAIGSVCVLSSFFLRDVIEAPTPWRFLIGFSAFFYIMAGITFKKYEKLFYRCYSSTITMVLFAILYGILIFFNQYYWNFNGNMLNEANVSWSLIGYLVISLTGIFSFILVVKSLPTWRPMLFVGRYSLVYYFLNGGVILLLSMVFRHWELLLYNGNHIRIIVFTTLSIIIISACTSAIVRFMPWMIGQRGRKANIGTQLINKKNA